MNKIYFSLFIIFLSLSSGAQIPNGYYDDASGLSGEELKTALYNIIKGHDSQSYSSIWTHFYSTDAKPNGKVWDMYSDVPGGTPPYEYDFGGDQCGNYSQEGDCYNREHSFPKSWFDDAAPMKTDLFHIVPTDGYVNSKRSNYPFGETNSPTWTSMNGSKKGNNSTSGYSGIIFEPIDEYKGDFARIYFYMATRYENIIANWDNNSDNADAVLNGTSYPVFEEWCLNLLMDWDANDPVSQKEIDRNNEIYDIQNNRNPFVDHPDWVNLVWGENEPPVITNVSFTPQNPDENEIVSVTATITDDGSITSAVLHWGFTSSNLSNNVNMTNSGSTYSAQIPGQSAGQQVYFQIEAVDDESSITQSSIYNYQVNAANEPPVITNVSFTPQNPDENEIVTITATITDDGSVSSAVLRWGFSSSNLSNNVSMTNSGSTYSAQIPGQSAGQQVYFQIEAIDDESNTTQSSIYNYQVNTANEPPVITNVSFTPQNPDENEIVTVTATISDDGSISSAVLHWGFSSSNLSNDVSMSNSGSIYSAQIPGQSEGQHVYFRIEAVDDESNMTLSAIFDYQVNDNTTNQPPVISNVSQTPEEPYDTDHVYVSAQITDDDAVESASIYYGSSEDQLNNNVEMLGVGNDYTGVIPPQEALSTVYYKIRAVDTDNASTDSQIYNYFVDGTFGIGHIQDQTIIVYPNPTNQYIQLQGIAKDDEVDIKIIHSSGMVVYKDHIHARDRIDISHLPSSYYLVQLSNGKFIKTIALVVY